MPLQKYIVTGGEPLRGSVRISGSKNACLPLMCAALLADGTTTIRNVPDLRDIRSMMYLLEHLNARVELRDGTLSIDSSGFDTCWVPYDIMRKMRASMYAFGPTIARFGKTAVSHPGGCNIGNRPIDLHLMGFRQLGVEVEMRSGYIHARHKGLVGTEMDLRGARGVSVGATCNVLMASVLASGRTVINGAAREPEVAQLVAMLNAMGARIEEAEPGRLVIDGVRELRPVDWRVGPDRIETATFATAALLTDGDVMVQGVDARELTSTLWVLRKWGAEIDHLSDDAFAVRRGPKAPHPLDLKTEPYPGLPTDIQPALGVLLGITPGESTIQDTIYPERFMYADELNRLGGNFERIRDGVRVNGVDRYIGAPVMASDLRAGAALVIAALAAEGVSDVRRIYHIERGYENFDRKLAALGARIRRLADDDDFAPPDEALAEEMRAAEAEEEARAAAR